MERTVCEIPLAPPVRLGKRCCLHPHPCLDVRARLQGPQVPHHSLEAVSVRPSLHTSNAVARIASL